MIDSAENTPQSDYPNSIDAAPTGGIIDRFSEMETETQLGIGRTQGR